MSKSILSRSSSLLFAFALMAVGCSGEPGEEGDVTTPDALHQDSLYMRSVFEQSGAIEAIKIDLGDDRQLQFVQNRLRNAGIVPETAPKLYERLTAARERAVAMKSGKLAPNPAITSAVSPVRCNVYVVHTQLDTAKFDTTSRGSCINGSTYSYVDHYQYDMDGNALAYNFKEEWNGGVATDVKLSSVPTANTAVWADGFAQHTTSTTDEYYYYATSYYSNHIDSLAPVAKKDSPSAQAVGGGSTTSVIGTLSAPIDMNANGTILMCLERNTSSTDCDYKHTSNVGGICSGNSLCQQNSPLFPVEPAPYNFSKLYMPMAGDSPLVATHNANNPWVIEYARAWLTMRTAGSQTGAGGFCSRELTGIPNISTQLVTTNGAQRVKVVINKFAPALGNAEWPDHCIDNGRSVDLDVEVKLKQQKCASNCQGPAVTWTTRTVVPAQPKPPMAIWWGCLPPGTGITMANGAQMSIENIGVGDKVVADSSGRMLTVVDVIDGRERKPLVHVLDDRGNIVKLTNTHPILTAEEQAIQAQELMIGDRIVTKDGPTTVVALDKRDYDGPIFNLVLGTPEELEGLSHSATTMFADGVMVGDGRMQGVLKLRADAAAEVKRSDSVPEELREDYRYSMLREQARSSTR